MSIMINLFLIMPFGIRVSFTMFLIFAFWWIFRVKILWLLSLIPFLLTLMFRGIYLLIELPIAALHNKYAMSFGKIDNTMSEKSNTVDSLLLRWYGSWHSTKRIEWWKTFRFYLLAVALIIVPTLINIETKSLRIGEEIYLTYEKEAIDWMESHGWYDPEKTVYAKLEEISQVNQTQQVNTEPSEIPLTVSGVETSLLVRDTPTIDTYNVLERLYNDDVVKWFGLMVFSEVEDNRIEPWVKIITPSGSEGWARLYYLYPETEDIQLDSDSTKIIFKVIGIKSSLLVRDHPSNENYEVLERLHNNDTANWSGSMVFSKDEKGSIDVWVKVITANGYEGWTKLYYLYPENNEEINYILK